MDQKSELMKSSPPDYDDSNSKYPTLPTGPIMAQPIQQNKLAESMVAVLPNSNIHQAIAGFLSRLNNSTELVIEQRLRLVEILVGWMQENKFYLWQDRDLGPMYGEEDSSCWCRQFCGNRREFRFFIKDGRGNVLLKVERPLNCSMFCGALFPDSLVVKMGNEQILGYVREKVNFVPHFAIMNQQGQTVFELKSRLIPCTFGSGDRVKFRVTESATNKTVAKIIKHWGGACQECCSNADKYTIQFGSDWAPETKALLLGTLFLINMRHYEQCCGFFQSLCLSMAVPRTHR